MYRHNPVSNENKLALISKIIIVISMRFVIMVI